METHRIETLNELINLSFQWQEQDQVARMFRGVSNESHQLIPSVGRPNTEAFQQAPGRAAVEKRERFALELFEDQCVFHMSHRPRDKLELLVVAQHHGLPTRLLDWTWSPLVAMFFAVQAGDLKVDGAIYVTAPLPDIRDVPKGGRDNPLDVRKDYLIAPPHINARVVAQKSVFSLHADPTIPLVTPDLKKVIFPGAAKHRIRKDLYHLGVDASTIFPGMDGIAATIKFLHFGPNI